MKNSYHITLICNLAMFKENKYRIILLNVLYDQQQSVSYVQPHSRALLLTKIQLLLTKKNIKFEVISKI